LAERLGTDYLGPVAFLSLRFGGGSVVIFAAHGHYSGLRTGGAINRIEDYANFVDADIYLMGHTHRISVQKEIFLTVDERGNVRECKRLFCLTGGFLRAYVTGTESYLERGVRWPLKPGTITVRITSKGFWGYE